MNGPIPGLFDWIQIVAIVTGGMFLAALVGAANWFKNNNRTIFIKIGNARQEALTRYETLEKRMISRIETVKRDSDERHETTERDLNGKIDEVADELQKHLLFSGDRHSAQALIIERLKNSQENTCLRLNGIESVTNETNRLTSETNRLVLQLLKERKP